MAYSYKVWEETKPGFNVDVLFIRSHPNGKHIKGQTKTLKEHVAEEYQENGFCNIISNSEKLTVINAHWGLFSGNFESEEDAKKWYNIHGVEFEKKGRKLKLFKL